MSAGSPNMATVTAAFSGAPPQIVEVAPLGLTGRRGSGFLTGSAAPQPSDGATGDYWIQQRPGQSSLLYGPKAAGAWPAQPSSALGVGGVADVPGLPAALASKASINGKLINDADYQILPTDTQVVLSAMSAGRTLYLPDVESVMLGQSIYAGDASGQCSPTRRITFNIPPGTNDTIEGQSGLTVEGPYEGLTFRAAAPNLWIVAR